MYKLMLKDIYDKEYSIYESNDIFDIDCRTGEYLNEKEMLQEMSERFNKKMIEVYIESDFNNKKKKDYNIVYAGNKFLDVDHLTNKYVNFLFGDIDRIRNSFIYDIPKFRNMPLKNISLHEVFDTLVEKFQYYSNQRKAYFHMFRCGEISLAPINKQEDDYLLSLIENIDTDNLTDEQIMIEKIKSGEIEPNYFDIDDYSSMKRHKR